MSRKADVAVIGGGVIGVAVAYYLSKAGITVILIEKGDIAQGTSSHCDGNVLVSDKMPGYDCLLAKASLDMFPDLNRELDYPTEWTQRGSLILIENEAEMAAAQGFMNDMVSCGIPMRMLGPEELFENEPLLARDLKGAIETACDGSLSPMGFCYGLAFHARRLGAELMLHTPVNDIEKSSGGFIIRTSGETMLAGIVVNCGGVWAPEIGKMVSLDIPIKARQGQILVSEQTFSVGKRKIYEFGYMMAKFQGSGYRRAVSKRVEENGVAFVFEPTHAGNFLIGSSRRFVGMDTDNDIQVMKALAERALRFFPVLKDIKVIRAYAGLRPYTPDHMPIVSSTPVPGFYIAAGHEGDGIGLAPVTGRGIAGMIAGNPPFMDFSPLRYERFL